MILKPQSSVKELIVLQLTADKVETLLAELKAAYQGFRWESELWAKVGHRRSPYRTLVLFGLSARTRDALLVEVCREFFRRFPTESDLAAADGIGGAVESIVRPGQVPFVASMAESLEAGVPREREELLEIKGVGEKISECVLAYGWGKEALPLDANCVRVLERVAGVERSGKGRPDPGPLRDSLKTVYLKQSQRFAELRISLVDVHEILRLHGQVCCTRTPNCGGCPVSGCLSRREPQDGRKVVQVSTTYWDDWRELINEPVSI